MRLTAAQPGPWLRPATYRPSRIDIPNHAEPPDKGHPVKTQKRQTNSSSITLNKTPGGGQSKGRGAKTRALGGAKRVPSLVTLVKTKNCFLATQTVTTVNEVTLNRLKNTHAPIQAPDVMHLSEGRGDGQKKRRAPTSNKPRHNHNRSERGVPGRQRRTGAE